jgi:sulfur carrier protein ThiS
VKLFVNKEQIVDRNLDIALDIDDEVEILAAIGGG